MHYDPLRLGPCPKDLSEWTSLPPPNNTPPTTTHTSTTTRATHASASPFLLPAPYIRPAKQLRTPPSTIRLYTALLSALTYLSRTLHFQVPTGQLIDTLRRLAARARQLHPPQPYIAYISALRSPFTPAIAYISTLRSPLFAPPLVTIHTSHSLHIYSQVIIIRTTSSRTPLPAVACQVAHAPSHSSRDILHHSTSDIRPASHCTTHARSDSLSPQAVVE